MDDEDDCCKETPTKGDKKFEDPSSPVSSDLKLYAWGRQGCGAESEQFKIDPEPLNLSLITQIKLIACGTHHALIVD